MQTTKLLPSVILVAAIAAIVARELEWQTLFDFLKPLTTVLIIGYAYSLGTESKSYKKVLLIALTFCLLGDVLLLREQYFIYGLGSFLVGHLFFITALVKEKGLAVNPYVLIFSVVAAALYYFYLSPYLGAMKIPVLIYCVVIIAMMQQATSMYVNSRIKNGFYAGIALASILFVISDGLIAYSKFVQLFPYSGAAILATYWMSLFLFARSVSKV